MIKQFRKGDLVRPIDFTGASGWELKPGAVYEVLRPEDEDQCLTLVGIAEGFFSSRFELVPQWTEDSLPAPTVLGTQIGGSHYTDCAIQPITYIWANGLGFSEGNIVKYVSRWKGKGGIKDLRKMVHHGNLLIEHAEAEEKRTGVKYGL